MPGRGVARDEVELGKVVGVFGVRGEVRLHLHNRESSVLLDAPADVVLVAPDGSRRSARLACRPGAGKRILGRIEGLDQREEAAAMKGTRIAMARADLPPTDEGEFYVTDLQHLPVFIDGEAVGKVVDIHTTAGGDLLEARIDGDSVFVPFASPLVLEVDVEAGQVVLDPAVLEED